MDRFVLEITVADERDGEGRADHPTFEAMQALLDALPENLRHGFKLHSAQVIEGVVDRDGGAVA